MQKEIFIKFDTTGVKIEQDIDAIRQGDADVLLTARFLDKNNANYVAKYTLTRPDGKIVKGTMNPADTSTDFEKVLDSAYYFAVNGEATLTVFLFSANSVLAQGQVSIAVEKTDFSEETTITPDEYDELVELIASKLNIQDGIIVVETKADIGEVTDYEIGQIFFVLNGAGFGTQYINHKILVQVISGYAYRILFDFTDIKAGKITSVQLINTPSSQNNILQIQLKGENDTLIAQAFVTLSTATTTQAGLMSADDKANIVKKNTENVFQYIPQTTEGRVYNNDRQLTDKEYVDLAVDGFQDDLDDHIEDKTNPHEVTKTQVGLGNVSNDLQVKATEKGVASGVATLDSNAKIPLTQLPDGVLGQLHYKGVWDASSGDSSITASKGDYYVCQVGGRKNPDGTQQRGQPYEIGDWSVYNGSDWDKVDNTDAVVSVQGRTGQVVITKNDLSLENVNNTSDMDKPVSTATAIELAKKQNKIKTSQVAPDPDDYEENDVVIIPSAHVGEDVIGEGLKEQLNIATRIKTLSVDFDVVAKKTDIPSSASQVHALPDTTKYGAGIGFTMSQSDYKLTIQLKDQDGNNLGDAKVVDLPFETMVVGGSYDTSNKKIILTLKNGQTIDIPVADLVSGLATTTYVDNKDYVKTQTTGGAASIQLKFWVGTQDEYDAITTKDTYTQYSIVEE